MEEEEKEFIPIAIKVIPKDKQTELLKNFKQVLEKYKKDKKEKLGI